MKVETLPPLLEELVEVVPTTLPFLKISTCEVTNAKTNNEFTGVMFEYRNQKNIPEGYCTALSIGIDIDKVIFAIHCVGMDDMVMYKDLENVSSKDLLSLLHQSMVSPDLIS